MKILCVVLMVGLCLGCAGLQIKEDGLTMESMIEKSRTCEMDPNGWKVLGVPDKDFDNSYIEFIFFTKEKNWGMGFMQHSGTIAFRQAVIIYNDDAKEWYAIVDGQVALLTPEQAKEGLAELWKIALENGDFEKTRPFKILTPVPKTQI